MLRRHEIIREDICEITGLSISRVNTICATRGFPKPTRIAGHRKLYDRREVKRYFANRIDHRTVEGRKHRRRK